MFIFAHIFAGNMLGLVIARVIRDTRVIPFCIAGAILPDLIDKPLGYFFFPQALDSGRTFFHSLLIAGIILALALVVLRFRRTFVITGLAAVIVLHQLLDVMWREPVTWFYPLLGPFQPYHYVNYFVSFFWLEITSASEWIFLCATLTLLMSAYDEWFDARFPPLIPSGRALACYAVLLLLFVLGMYSFVCGVAGTGNTMAPYNTPEGSAILGAVALAGCGIFVASQHTERLTIT